MTYPVFSVGEVLRAQDMNAVGMWLISSTSWSGTTSVTVNNVFSSEYESYRVMVTAGTSPGSSDIAMTLQPSSTTAYAYQLVFNSYTGGTPSSVGTTGAGNWAIAGGSGAGTVVVNADIFGPNLAQWTGIGATTATATGGGYFAGNYRGSNQFTGFTLASGSTVSNATVRVYGYRK
jgi:hypothetical protein